MITFLRQYVFHNFLLKLVALAAAVLLWMAISNEPRTEVAITVPIEFQHVPQDIEITTEKIPQAQVRVSGPGRVVRNLADSDIHAIIDLTGVHPGERTYDLTSRQIHVPPEVEVVQIGPTRLHLDFDRVMRKDVPIRARINGLPAHAGSSVEPGAASIVGPEKQVQKIDAAMTDAVDASGGNRVFQGVHVFVADPAVRVERPALVTVTVTTQSTH